MNSAIGPYKGGIVSSHGKIYRYLNFSFEDKFQE